MSSHKIHAHTIYILMVYLLYVYDFSDDYYDDKTPCMFICFFKVLFLQQL
jgi:hypothetical protein